MLSANEKEVLRHFARDTDVGMLSDGDRLAVDDDDVPSYMTPTVFRAYVRDLAERGYVEFLDQDEHTHTCVSLLQPARDFLVADATDDE